MEREQIMDIDKYYQNIGFTFDEINQECERLKKEIPQDYFGDYPSEKLKTVVYNKKIRDHIIVMKIDSLTFDEKSDLDFSDWKEFKTNIYRWYNQHTGNIFIIDAS